jgi:hypothetical protein
MHVAIGTAAWKLLMLANAIKETPLSRSDDVNRTSFCNFLAMTPTTRRPRIIPVPKNPISTPKPEPPRPRTSSTNPTPSEKTPPAAVNVKPIPRIHGRTCLWVATNVRPSTRSSLT